MISKETTFMTTFYAFYDAFYDAFYNYDTCSKLTAKPTKD